MKKRILSTLLALAMCLTLLPTAALADGEDAGGDTPSADTETAGAETAAENGYTDEGFCEAYEWSNGVLTKKGGASCSHDGCNGYQPATTNDDGVLQIGNAGQLYWFAVKVNDWTHRKTPARLTDDITLNEDVLNADGTLNGDGSDLRQWTPINFYMAAFDGAGHTISGLYLSDSGSENNVGMFGQITATTDGSYIGHVKGLTLEDSYIDYSNTAQYGTPNIGGIVGYLAASCTVENCTVSATVKGTAPYPSVGGIVGSNNGTVSRCVNTGAVSASGNGTGRVSVGGIVGYNNAQNSYGIVAYCCNTGAVSASNNDEGRIYCGGVVGNLYGGCQVSGCYNTGKVSRDRSDYQTCVGGVAGGVSSGGNNFTIRNCCSLSTAASSTVGTSGGTVTNTEKKDAAAFASGEVTWLLNGNTAEGEWYQTIGADTAPTLNATHGKVYYGYQDCKSPKTYTNDSTVAAEPPHQRNDKGVCTVCGDGCDHESYDSSTGKCTTCGCEHDHTDLWENGECSFCHYKCEHSWNSTTGKCETCKQAHDHTGNWRNGECSVCKYACTHSYDDTTGKCTTCGMSDPSRNPCKEDGCDGAYDADGFCSVNGSHYQPATLNGDVYEISNAGQLYWFASQVNDIDEDTGYEEAFRRVSINGRLTQDITINAKVLQDDGTPNSGSFRQWTPIGYSGYCGTFDGNGKTISGLYCSSSDGCAGLFGFVYSGTDDNGTVKNGTVKNVTLEDSYLYSERDGVVYVGGIAAYNSQGAMITNCTVNATVSGKCTGDYDECAAYIGGIVGHNAAVISLCANFGAVSGVCTARYALVGGIVGETFGSYDTVTNCYNTGRISVNASHPFTAIGGVVGRITGNSTTNCYSVGTVSRTDDESGEIGGVAGEITDGEISNCYWQKGESDTLSAVGNIDNNATVTDVEGKTAEDFVSGEVTWLLNGKTNEGTLAWYQNLSGSNVDTAPTLDNTHGTVYHGYVAGGCTEAYSNSPLSTNPTHNWGDDGKCQNEGCDTTKAVARIDDVYYTTFSEAYEKAKDGDTITLLANVQHTALSKNITLTIDLNKKTWEHTDGANLDISAGKYTIMNGTVSETVILRNAELTLETGFKLEGDYRQLNIGSGAVLNVMDKDAYVEELCVGASDSFTCDLTRGKFGTVRISDGSPYKVIDLLAEGYAFRTIGDNPTWYDQYHNPDATSIQNVMVNNKWITGVTLAADKESYTFGETVKLTATVERHPTDTAGIYYDWYKDDDETPFATTQYDGNHQDNKTPHLNDYSLLSAGEHTIYVKVTTHNYTRTSNQITVTVNKATPVITGATATVTYGDAVSHSDITPPADAPAGSYRWKNVTSYGDATDGTPKTLTATFTPADTTNYNSVDVDVSVTVNKATYNGTKTATGSAKYGNPGEVDLSALIADGGTLTVGTATDSNSVLNTENGMPKLDGNKLQFAFNDNSTLIGETVEVPVNVSDCTNYKDYTITVTLTVDAKDVPAVTAPTAVENLTYNGSDQTLINAATTTGGTLQYKLGENGTWSAELPKAKNADTYTVYYKVVGDTDYADVAVDSISVTIGRKAVTIKPTSYTITRGSSIPTFALEYVGLVSGDSLSSAATPIFTCYEADGSTAVSTSTAAGSYTITWTNSADFDFSGETNYTVSKEITGTLTIKANSSSGGSGSTAYAITVKDSENGDVTANRKTASKGTIVTVTVTPDAGYTLETLSVTDKNGNEITLTDNGDGTYSFKMPAGKVIVEATFMDDNTMLNFFVDVSAEDYYYDAVLWAVKNGITGGIGNDQFGPDLSCARAQLVAFLYRAAVATGIDVSVGADTNILSYTDALEIPEYALEAFQWAVGAGIVEGADDALMPNDDCTRAQIVTMLFRYAAANGMEAVTLQELVGGYGDAASVPSYAIPAFNWALAKGILQGYNGNLMPNNDCTRAQIVTMLYRLLGTN